MNFRNIMMGTAAVFAAFAAQPSLAQTKKEQLVIGQLQFLTNFHPLIQVNNTKRNVITYGLRPITAFDENAVNQCVLCETLPTLENGLAQIVDMPDGTKGMKVKITLKQGLAWGDGVPVTSRDIAFTLQMALEGKIGFSNYNPWDRASKAEIIDDRTVVLTLPRVLPSFNSWDQVLPAHLEEPIYKANSTLDGYVKQTLYNTNPTNPGLWNGSYKLTDYQIGTRITFEPNPHWPGKKPELKRIVLSYRDNSSALMQNLLAGEIDAVPVSPGGISFSQMLDLQKRAPKRFAYHIDEGTNLERIAMNLDNPILADVRVRKALLHAIDRQAITKALFEGQQAVANGILSNANPFYNKDMPTYTFDPKRARALLTEAGWTQGRDGICVDKSGKRLSLELATTAGNQTREQIALVIQSLLKNVCVEIVNKFVPLSEYNGALQRQRKFAGLAMSSIDFSPSTSPRIALGSDAIPKADNNYVGNNFSGYSSKAMDAALTELESALDRETSKQKWAEVQRVYAEELPMLPLYFYARAYVTVPDLVDFRQGTFDPLHIWSEEWRRS
jgi:peptide/nickel transport system substrate-binding protein